MSDEDSHLLDELLLELLLPRVGAYLLQVHHLVEDLRARLVEQLLAVELAHAREVVLPLRLEVEARRPAIQACVRVSQLPVNKKHLNASACCSTDSLTMRQKHSDTAIDIFRVVICVARNFALLQFRATFWQECSKLPT